MATERPGEDEAGSLAALVPYHGSFEADHGAPRAHAEVEERIDEEDVAVDLRAPAPEPATSGPRGR